MVSGVGWGETMITSIAFTVYSVSDMAAARRFYEGVLKLSCSSNFRDEWIEYDLGESTFAITTIDMGHTPGAPGGVVAFEVTDLDAFVQGLKQSGVPFVVEPMETGVCRMAVIQDPDRNHLTIHKRHAG